MAKASDLSERMRQTALKEKPKPVLEAVPESVEPVAVDPVSVVDKATPASETTPVPGGEGRGLKRGQPRSAATSRYTIDLAQSQRKALKLFALNLDCDASEVVRSLLSMLQESKEIQAQVAGRVQAARSSAVAQ